MTRIVRRVSAVVLPLLMVSPVTAQSMAGAGSEPRAGFGAAVAVGDGEVFVGESANVTRPGLVYVYRPGENGRWAEVEQLRAPDAEASDGFGTSLAARPGMLLVGQSSEDGPGRVHVFVPGGDGWEAGGELEPEVVTPGDAFGATLAVSGPLAAVGAPGANDGAGRVHVFGFTRGGWEEMGILEMEEPGSGNAFGSSIALDGTRILVGAPGHGDGGAAVLFRQDPGSGEWSQEGVLTGSGSQRRSGFGSAVALAGPHAFVAAPAADNAAGAVYSFLLDALAEEWSLETVLRPFDASRYARFGSALALSGEGLYVGAPGADGSGALYVIRRGEDAWTGVDKVATERVDDGGSFGRTLALRGDVAVVGATGIDHGMGGAVILAREEGSWAEAELVISEPESLPALTGGEVRCEAGSVAGTFACADVDLLSFLPVGQIGGDRGVEVNDVWGWTDPETGREYALVGRIDGTSFVDVTNPTNPRYLGDLPKTEGSRTNVWRDIKVYDDHAFIVADGAGEHGMQVFDLTRLRNVQEPVTFDADAHYDRIASSHNIVIDEASGFAFAVGSRDGGETCGGGLHMIDVRRPTMPEFAGCFADPQTGRASTGYSHDAQCVTYAGPDADYAGREICLGSNETALSIADVTDKENPVAVARATYPNVGYAHQGWLTEDQRYFYMNDELDELQGKTSRTRTLIWDVTDLDDPQLVGEFMGTTEASDHNLYIRDNLMYQSNYVAGLRIIDITEPESPREVGFFDTVPHGTNSPGFDGSWSNYPFFPSGTIIVTSGREGLFLLRKREPVS